MATSARTSRTRKKSAKSAPKKKRERATIPYEGTTSPLDPLDLIKQVLRSQDMLFLSRQVAYHIASEAELPDAWANTDQVRLVLSKLMEHIVKRSPRRSNISINLKEFSLRCGPGVEFKIISTDRLLEKMDRSAFMASLFTANIDSESGVSLTECRESILRQRGRFWVDLPKTNQPVYHVVLPTSEEVANVERAEHYTFKYDILISNFAAVRKRFGICKSQSLVEQIEHYVRSLVRYPMDMVMSVGEEGIITTIYETEGGIAESVASRISQRLGREIFRIGKNTVELTFKYHLSALKVTPANHRKAAHKRSF
ncbi:MAG: hypothetical protein ABH871_03705 [Pseudomonadota bacterium]